MLSQYNTPPGTIYTYFNTIFCIYYKSLWRYFVLERSEQSTRPAGLKHI